MRSLSMTASVQTQSLTCLIVMAAEARQAAYRLPIFADKLDEELKTSQLIRASELRSGVHGWVLRLAG